MPIKKQAEKQEQKLPDNDHRALGQKLDLFSFHEVAPGAPFWHHKGMLVFRELEQYVRKLNDESGYLETSTPILVKKELFEQSGHWEHYRENMFWFANPRDKKEVLALKPMNCPESTLIYNAAIRSYHDLPLRLAEIGRLHRNERSGTLGGLFRVRQLTMDDAHIYIRPDQAEDEIVSVIALIERFYALLGFKSRYVLATRPTAGGALGTKKEWQLAETALANALKKKNIPYLTEKGAGAFYGPKIEVHMEDSQGRDWQMGTAQLDLVMLAKQFKLSYADAQGKKQKPWVIHRAILGSFERFIGILLEHFNGALPMWLAPVQTAVLPVSEKFADYAKEVASTLTKESVRVELHDANETLGKRIREAELQKIPYLLIVGEREVATKTVAVRERGKEDRGQMTGERFLAMLKTQLPI